MKKTVVLFFAWLPLAAFGQPPQLTIEPIVDNVWLHTSFHTVPGQAPVSSNGLIIVQGDDAYLVDTAWSEADTQRIVEWLNQRDLQLKAAVITHFHDDRSAGLGFLNRLNIPTFASAHSNSLLGRLNRAQASEEFSAPTQTIADMFEIFYPGPGHAEDNHVVYLPEQRVLFGGCLVRPAATDNLGNVADANVDQWATSVQNVQERYPVAAIIIPGHGAVGGPELLEHTRTLAQLRQMEEALDWAN